MSAENLIAEVKALDAAATSGPWESAWTATGCDDVLIRTAHEFVEDAQEVIGITWYDRAWIACSEADALLITRFRTLAPQLADALEEAQNAYREALDSEARRVVAEAALREERLTAEGLRERLAEAEKNRDGAEMRGFRGFTFGQLADARDAAEARAVAAEARCAELEKALEPLARLGVLPDSYRRPDRDTAASPAWYIAGPTIDIGHVRAARRALGRP